MKRNHYGFGIFGLLLVILGLGSVVGIGVYTYRASQPTVVHTPTVKKPAVTPNPKPPNNSLVLTDDDKGKTVSIAVGKEFSVSLASTYWSFTPLVNESVVTAVGDTVPTPDRSCLPGVGCGTQTQKYKAVATGTVTISASRVSCGEAMACGKDAGSYSVTIKVQ